LTVPVQGYNNLHESFDGLTSGELIDGYQCDGCAQKVTVQK